MAVHTNGSPLEDFADKIDDATPWGWRTNRAGAVPTLGGMLVPLVPPRYAAIGDALEYPLDRLCIWGVGATPEEARTNGLQFASEAKADDPTATALRVQLQIVPLDLVQAAKHAGGYSEWPQLDAADFPPSARRGRN